ncbi:sensor domain-containing diguanylate cyclase [Paenibacillus turpanensis]|uniref:sensor domain-containing diguanylate cyclase n=1 Tax=Paenibacillus turpanensis TaxID=2689078 RepID=UPI0014080DE2|nr:sensor domain-containing diguanylate cyclase [Paenibacillus turpanensis]
MNTPKLLLNVSIVAVFFVSFIWLKVNYFHQLAYSIHLSLDLAATLVVCLFLQPVLIHVLKSFRRAAISIVIGATFILSLLWNAERSFLFQEGLEIELYFFPIILSSLYLSMRTSLIAAAAAALSHMILNLFFIGFRVEFLLQGALWFLTLGLMVMMIVQTMRSRDKILNKRNVLIQESNSLILGMDSAGKIDLCNKKMVDLFGLESTQIMGQYFWKIEKLVVNKEALKIFQLLHDDIEHKNGELELEMSGEVHCFIIDSYALKDNGLISGKMIVLRDISERKEMEQQLLELSITDELTKLHNRRYFDQKFKEEIIRSERYHHPLSLILVDLDHFKRINDTYGHSMGDEVLKRVASALRESVRLTDLCARMGGEEFVVLLPETDATEAFIVANRISECIRELAFEGFRITASLGVTTHLHDFHNQKMIDAADQALYLAKESGRNQVCVAE